MHTFSRPLQALSNLRTAAALCVTVMASAPALAGGVYVSVNLEAPGAVLRAVGVPHVVRQPVYGAQPAPVYAPRQVVYGQPEVVYVPPQVVYREPPRVVYAPVHRPPHHHHHHHHHRHHEGGQGWGDGWRTMWDDRGAGRWEGRHDDAHPRAPEPPMMAPRGGPRSEPPVMSPRGGRSDFHDGGEASFERRR